MISGWHEAGDIQATNEHFLEVGQGEEFLSGPAAEPSCRKHLTIQAASGNRELHDGGKEIKLVVDVIKSGLGHLFCSSLFEWQT